MAEALRAEKKSVWADEDRSRVWMGTNWVEVAELPGYGWHRKDERWWLLALAGQGADWASVTVEDGNCLCNNKALLTGSKLHLEAFEYEASADDALKTIAEELAALALPQNAEYEFFRKKLASDLVLLSDTDFGYFAEYAMLVEPHVRINEKTGTADDGGLFYTENLPPESLLIAPLMVGKTRTGKGEESSADDVLQTMKSLLNGQLLQVGGDATTGRGLVVATVQK